MIVTIDRAGRIVVPKSLRDRFDLVAGAELEMEMEGVGDCLQLRRVDAEPALVRKKGTLVHHGGARTDLDVAAFIRAPRERTRVEGLTGFLGIVYPDDRFASVHARLLAGLQRGGETIATMDLMVAAAAVVDEAPLVTRNRRHFDRVPGVDVVSY